MKFTACNILDFKGRYRRAVPFHTNLISIFIKMITIYTRNYLIYNWKL